MDLENISGKMELLMKDISSMILNMERELWAMEMEELPDFSGFKEQWSPGKKKRLSHQ